MGDARLLELRQDIALLDVRLSQLYHRVGTGESSARWQALGARLAAYRRQEGAPGEGAALRALIAAILEPADGDHAAWDDIREATEHRRRLVESERRLVVERSQMMTVAEMSLMIDNLMGVIRRNVPDRQALLAISRDVQALAHVPERQQATAEG